MVVGDVAGIARVSFAGDMGEGVPDGGAATVLVDRTLDLVGSGGGSPKEAGRK